jgi:hypothetical protein
MSDLPSIKTLTLREAALIEGELGVTLEEALRGPSRWRALGLVICAFRQRTDPSYTLERALDENTMESLAEVASEHPTVAAS